MNRRKFFGGLFGGSVGAVAVSALQSIAPIEQVSEVKKNRRYIFKLNGYAPVEAKRQAGEMLAARGIDAIVIDEGVESIYEIS